MPEAGLQPLFIVGAPRSGTSLLRNLLRAFDGVYMPPDETQFFPAYIRKAAGPVPVDSLVSFLDRTAFSMNMRSRGYWPTRADLLDILSDPAPESALPELMRFLARQEGQDSIEVWGDKTPRYIHFLDLFREAFPGMRVLFVMRDPRDAVLSMRDAWGRSLVRGAVAWREAARIATAECRRPESSKTMVMHYEALAAEPAAATARIAAWLGVNFSTNTIDRYTGEEKWGAVRGAGISNSSVGRYRTKLPQEETELIERIAFHEMRSWGYAVDYATSPYEPGAIRLRCARLADGLNSLHRYGQDRGFARALSYKIRQFVVARRGDGG